MTSEFTWEHSAGEFFHPAVNCSTIDSFRNTQGASHYSGSTRSSIWKKILLSWEMLSDGIENLIENWSAWFLQTNLISTVLNTKFEYSHVFLSWLLTCLKFKYKRSRFPNDLKWIQPSCCMYNVALCERANTVATVIVHIQIQYLFESKNLNLKKSPPTPRFHKIRDFKLQLIRAT